MARIYGSEHDASVAELLLDAVEDAILVIDRSLRVTYANLSTRTVLGLGDPEQGDPQQALGAIHPDDVIEVVNALDSIIADGAPHVTAQFRVRHHESATGWKPVVARAMNHLATPGIEGVVVCFRDVEQLVAHRRRADELAEALDATNDLVAVHHFDGTLIFANAALRRLAGWDHDLTAVSDGVGWPYGPKWSALFNDEISPSLIATGRWAGEYVAERGNGDSVVLWIQANGGPAGSDEVGPGMVALTGSDITAELRARQDLYYTVRHDPVTDLPNRLGLHEHLGRLIEAYEQDNELIVVLSLELDSYKTIVDGLGQAMGDDLSRQVAERLRRVTRPIDMFASTGADQFALVLTQFGDDQPSVRAQLVAGRLHDALRAPFELSVTDVYLFGSIGIAVVEPNDDPAGLVRKSQLAVRAAADRGRERTEVFHPELASFAESRLRIESSLHEVLAERGLKVVYQPIVHLASGIASGVEALVRWPGFSEDDPSEFLHVAERTDLITHIDTFVLNEACRQLAEWNDPSLSMSVNMSAAQLVRHDIVAVVSKALKTNRLAPERLTLEMTETSLYSDMSLAMSSLGSLRSLGVRLAIDDFGTGHSSLSHLRQFKVDTVKIDRSFLLSVADGQIISAVVSMAKALALTTVAEGVEQPEQVGFLRSIGCERAQGYLFSRPVAPGEVRRVLAGIRTMAVLSPT